MPNKSQTVPGHIAPPLKPNYRTYSGRFPSRKAKRAIFYTSVLENDALLLLETDPAIDDLGPYEDIAWLGRGREESFLRLWFRRGETKTLLGVGHAETFAEITDWIKAMRSKAIKRGYRLETWTETDIRVGRQVENARRIFYESSRVLDPDPDLHCQSASKYSTPKHTLSVSHENVARTSGMRIGRFTPLSRFSQHLSASINGA